MAFRKALTQYDDYREMIGDPVRAAAYAEAIQRAVRPGDVVLDLGAGLGILSFLALRAGAARVYAVEKSDAIELARKVARANGLEDRIRFLPMNSKDCVLDERVDLLLSETLGSFGVEENTLDFTIDARDRLLAPGGRMLPHRLQLFLAPVESHDEHHKVAFWEQVQGFDFSPARDDCVSRMSLADVRPDQLLGEPQRYADLDLRTVTERRLEARHLFPITRPGTLHGLAGWFEVELFDGVSIATSPAHPATHWRQAFFPLRAPIRVVRGDFMEAVLRVAPESALSDNTTVSYDVRCTQIGQLPEAETRRMICPCGSGRKFRSCCGS